MIRLDVEAFLPGQSFKAMFALDGLVGVRGELAVIEDLPTRMVQIVHRIAEGWQLKDEA